MGSQNTPRSLVVVTNREPYIDEKQGKLFGGCKRQGASFPPWIRCCRKFMERGLPGEADRPTDRRRLME